MKIIDPKHDLLILSQDYEAYWRLIINSGLHGLSIHGTPDTQEVILIGAGCDVLLGEPLLISQVINQLPGVTWVQTTWAGVEPLMAPGLRQNYLLTNARNVYGPLMSEYVFGYLLAIERQILHRWIAQRDGKWDASTPGTLQRKLLGLCGVGTIGAYLACTAKYFGMRVYGYTRQSETCLDVEKYFHGAAWREFACNLDYLVCSLPGTVGTKHLVDAGFLSALPQKAWIINVGRGNTVDEQALTTALTNRQITGAVLDVFSEEPLPQGHPLWSLPNTFITAHTAARNYLPDIASLFIENYRRYIGNEPLFYPVDFDQGY